MLFKTREKAKRLWFKIRAREILSTPPIKPTQSGLKLLSMVSHRDLIMYLIAVKSVYSFLGTGQIVVVGDGTLTPEDIEILKRHLSPVEIRSANEIQCGKCPRGGTWERLLLIAEYVEQDYVIQIDSDTLALADIPEIVNCIKENRSFTLGTSMGRDVVRMKDICEQMKAFDSDYVQVVAEKNFDKLRRYDHLKYVRGCSGFAGFARKSFSRSEVELFSEEMDRILGKLWSSWGSEQVTSNYFVANSPRSFVLPYPKYANFTPEIDPDQSSFLHFLGTYRFKGGVYLDKGRNVVKKLMAAQPALSEGTR